MKAYIARYKNSNDCTLIHGETVSQAKLNFQKWNFISEAGKYIDIRLIRLKGCDDKPFTFDNALAAGFHYGYEGAEMYGDNGDELLYPEVFENDCRCEVCKGNKKK